MAKKSSFPNIEKCNPRTCISSKMLKCQRKVSQVFRKHLLPFGITSSQLSILFIVAKAETVNQSMLAEWLALEKSTVSRNLKRLFERNLIKKENTQTLTMTHDGKVLLEQIIPEWNKAMKTIKSILKAEGEEALNVLFTQLVN